MFHEAYYRRRFCSVGAELVELLPSGCPIIRLEEIPDLGHRSVDKVRSCPYKSGDMSRVIGNLTQYGMPKRSVYPIGSYQHAPCLHSTRLPSSGGPARSLRIMHVSRTTTPAVKQFYPQSRVDSVTRSLPPRHSVFPLVYGNWKLFAKC